ncbi:MULTISPECIES: aldehyde dehydrogenase family protein [unclassified Nocardioides]|uniref:aldehyde dehydrogenase family protein n=1 Tax=unclassified Nocardioides TaxID=2615069 RepID=UPI000AEF17CE|nr:MULTISPECIES: aldehyde dehydrogenase family protein [unclassified Nocardioides]
MEFQLSVDGHGVDSAARFPVENPATGQVFAYAPDSSASTVDSVMASASNAFARWRSGDGARCEALARCAAAIMSAADELAALLTAEQGKPLADAMSEVRATAGWFSHFSKFTAPSEILQDDATALVDVKRSPLGVVLAITPWNYPLLLAGFKLAPALRAGNTVVLKPSPYTPLSSLALGEILSAVLPSGVVQVITGLDSLGPVLTRHPQVRKISFTGSTTTGRLVAESAARGLKHVTLELGGNDAAIMLDDLTPRDVVDRIFWSAFANNGQTCIAIKRLYVPRSSYEETVDLLAECANQVAVGAGDQEGIRLGPLNNALQLETVSSMVDAAVRAGADAVTGGRLIDRPGYFYEPTIVTGAADDSDLVAREQFGPALPVLVYDDLDEAVERANATDFGLGGSVWGTDRERAASVASRLDCGNAWVNTHMTLSPNLPFAATKSSGLGVENGLLGYLSFTELQTRHIPKG